MNIVVLDGYTLNPGDLTWDEFSVLGNCQVHDRVAPADVPVASRNADILLTNKTVLSGDVIRQLPRCKYIGVLATGTNVVDLPAARERGILVTNVPAYGNNSVAQHTFALLLELTNHVTHHAQTVREGKWSRCPDFSYWDYPLIELAGLTLGIVGFGRIGEAVARIGVGCAMKVVASNGRPRRFPEFVQGVDLETLFRTSDVVSLHCPLTPETNLLVNAQRLSWMKPSAFLLNTSRGQLIDESALANALNSGRLAGAGLDVLTTEPPAPDHPLYRAMNCLITPHNAWATRAARARLMKIAAANLRAFLDGKPQNVVN